MLELLKNSQFFSIFSSYGLFSQVFGEVNEWPISKLHEIIRVLHVVAYPIVFLLFDDPDWQGRVLQNMKNDQFLVYLAVWVFFLNFLGSLMSGLC